LRLLNIWVSFWDFNSKMETKGIIKPKKKKSLCGYYFLTYRKE